MKLTNYLKYFLKHKWYVLKYCTMNGHWWIGVIHDLSKLGNKERQGFVDWFSREQNHNTKKTFDLARLHHIHTNKHHWQYWILIDDDSGITLIEMPLEYIEEMICDWRGAQMAKWGRDKTKEWYLERKDIIQLAPVTRAIVEKKLGVEHE